MEHIYIRVRGNVQGPYTREKLRALASRGKFSRVHEVSEDGTVWRRATDFPDLFPRPMVPKKAGAQRETIDYVTRLAPDPAWLALEGSVTAAHVTGGTCANDANAPSLNSDMEAPDWYYAKDGTELGPVTFGQLRQLASARVLSRDDLVWATGLDSWVSAEQIDGIFSADESMGSWQDLSSGASLQGESRRSRLAIASLVFGILGTNVLLIVGSVAAIILGHLAIGRIRHDGRLTGHGMAISGIFLGYLVVIAALLVSVAIIVWLIVYPQPVASAWLRGANAAA